MLTAAQLAQLSQQPAVPVLKPAAVASTTAANPMPALAAKPIVIKTEPGPSTPVSVMTALPTVRTVAYQTAQAATVTSPVSSVCEADVSVVCLCRKIIVPNPLLLACLSSAR